MKKKRSGNAKTENFSMQFSLRALMISTILSSLPLGVFFYRVTNQKKTVDWITTNGGGVTRSYQYDSNDNFLGTDAKIPLPWLAQLIGIDGVSSVRDIFLDNLEVENLAPLENLAGVRTLCLDASLVQDLSSLSSIQSIDSLMLRHMKKSDFSNLVGMKYLRHLSLESCDIDFRILSGLSELETLEISRYDKVIDLQKIRMLSKLKVLNLSMVEIESLAVLSKLSSLRVINFTDVEGEGLMEKIEVLRLKISGCEINVTVLGPI